MTKNATEVGATGVDQHARASIQRAAERVDSLNLSMVKAQLNAAGWMRHLSNEVELEYRRLIMLALIHPDEVLAPGRLVELFWRQHRSEASVYAADCENVLESPLSNLAVDPAADGATNAQLRTIELYARSFPGWEMMYWDAQSAENMFKHYASAHPPLSACESPESQPYDTVKRSRDFAEQAVVLSQQQCAHLSDWLSSGAREALSSEASAHRRWARDWVVGGYQLGPNGRLSSPRSHRLAGAGRFLRALHEDPEVVRTLRELTGLRLFPTRVSYLYYRPGDYIGLHTDTSPCQLTMVASVLGETDPLILHPELSGVPTENLLDYSRGTGGQPEGGQRVEVPTGGALVLRGSQVPHRRPISREHHAVATLCYAALA